MSPSALMQMNSCQVLLDIAGLGPQPKWHAPYNPAIPLYGSFDPRIATLQERVAWFNALPETEQPIPGCHGYYVTKYGRFFRDRDGKREEFFPSRNRSCMQIALRRDDGTSWRGQIVHQAIYLTFIGPLVRGLVVDHINDDPFVNAAFNHQLLTQRENRLKGHKHRGKTRPITLFRLTSRTGAVSYHRGSVSAGLHAGCVCKSIWLAADHGTRTRSGYLVENLGPAGPRRLSSS